MVVWMFHFKLLLVTVLPSSAVGKIRLVNNGYEGVVVSVHWDVQENLDLFKELEDILTSASSVLFQATKSRLYFKDFIFVIPDNWQTKTHYENALEVEIEPADVIIDKANAAAEDRPYTLQTEDCGKSGKYMHLTPRYLLDKEVQKGYGSPGKTFVHEWGHLRWGLFDEYSLERGDQFYRFEDKWLPTRCSQEINGVLKNTVTGKYCEFDVVTGLPEENCRFIPSKNSKAVSSMMSYHFLDNIVQFCDNPQTTPKSLRHNRLAPSHQNKLCQSKSAWEVMRQHDDFKSRSNSAPQPDNMDTAPSFRYVQTQPMKRVLVLDTSESMSGTRLEFLRQGASNFILSSVENESRLGIVPFSSSASVVSELVTIDSQADRDLLVSKLPSTVTSGNTSIGAGLQLGRQVLTRDGQSKGGSIILITDGNENKQPYIRDVQPALISNGIVVHAFAYGQEADDGIAQLAKATGGRIFFYSGTENSTGLIDAFATLTATANSISTRNAAVSIQTTAVTINSNVTWNGPFFVDSTIGKDTTLTFSYMQPITVEIESPDGLSNPQNVTDYPSLRVLTVTFDGDLTPGLWTYHVKAIQSSSDVKINIESKPRLSDGEVIQIRSWVSEHDDITFTANVTLDVYAEVVRGKTPVLGAFVVATVERPQKEPLTLRLHDDEIGSDIIRGDGIYSATIIASDLSGNGRYNIKINVNGNKKSTRIVTGGQGLNSGAPEDGATQTDQDISTEPLEDFQRVTTAGEFRIIDYFPVAVDELAPARITDFEVKRFDFETMNATLEWTAVGGDMDRGQVSRYIVYISNDEDTIFDNIQSADRIPDEKVISGNLNSSAAPGQLEHIVVLVDSAFENSSNSNNNTTSTLYLRVSAVDQVGNEGHPSNIVTLSRATQLSIPRDVEEFDDSDSNSQTGMYLAIGISLACVALIVIVVVSVFLCRRAKRRKREPHETPPL